MQVSLAELANIKRAARLNLWHALMQEELGYNPFLRCQQLAVQKAVGESNPIQVLAALRHRKDTFGGLSAAVFGRVVNIVNAVGPLARMAGIRH